ncbi:MAG: DUF72 domain-containing protein [Desulfobacterales bacterium]|nr:DUF72 domain-containing protein [Desulfobacterales bacterium]
MKSCDCKILIGTSGYSYPEWVDAGFYKQNTKASQMLSLYSQKFSITELNYTWYQMPKSQSIERMQKQAPQDFSFTAKLTRTLTHEIDHEQWKKNVAKFKEGISPLMETKQLIAILLQFPKSFERIAKNRFYLASLLDELDGLPLAVEFRNAFWACDKVFSEFIKRQISLVIVDEPNISGLFPRLDVITNPNLFYIRFHGRNAKGWNSGNMQLQFDYDYKDEEIDEWVTFIEQIKDKSKKGVIFFNNHVRGQAPKNAQNLKEKLFDKQLVEKWNVQ